jgi:hypothetical protein
MTTTVMRPYTLGTMNIQLEIRPEPGFLSVGATGTFSLDEAKRVFLEMLEAVALHKTQRVLLDGRQLRGEPEVLERFLYGEFAAKSVRDFEVKGVSRSTRFAYVLKEPVLDPKRFGENVAVNRGMIIKVFDNPEDALRWLEIAPAGKTDSSTA